MGSSGGSFEEKLRNFRIAIENKSRDRHQNNEPETNGSFYSLLFGEEENFVQVTPMVKEDEDRDKKIYSSPERRRFREITKELPPAEMVCTFVKSIFERKNLAHNIIPQWFKRRITNTKNPFDDLIPLFLLIEREPFELSYTFHMTSKYSTDEIRLFSAPSGSKFKVYSSIMSTMQRELFEKIIQENEREIKVVTENLFNASVFGRVSVEPHSRGNSTTRFTRCIFNQQLNSSINRMEIIREIILILFGSMQPTIYFNTVYNYISRLLQQLMRLRPKSSLFRGASKILIPYKSLYWDVVKIEKEIFNKM